MARKPSTKPRAKKTPSISPAALLDAYADGVDEAKKDSIGETGSMKTHFISSGVAALDHLFGGGIPYGTWMTIAGAEQSAKSLLASTMAGSFCRQGIPKIIYSDAEASQEEAWMRAAMRDPRGASYFGETNAKGKVTVRPRIDYATTDIIEEAFGYVSQILKNMPDKLYDSVEDQWYLVLSPTDKRMARFRALLGEPDRKKSTKTKLWYPIDDPSPQLAWIADSWPMFNTDAEDEEGEASKALAVKARAYSKVVSLVRGKLKRKAALVIGINQLRKNPGAMYGPSETEPCGEALKYASSLRIHAKPLSVPSEWRNLERNSREMDEPSVEGDGRDSYMFKRIDLIKSKMRRASPQTFTWIRVWTSDTHGHGRGVDPVYDTWQFLFDAGFATVGNVRSKGRHCVEFLEGTGHPLGGHTLRWEELKKLVIAEVYPSPHMERTASAIWDSLGVSPLPLYQWCFDHMPVPSKEEQPDEEVFDESTQDEPETDEEPDGEADSAPAVKTTPDND